MRVRYNYVQLVQLSGQTIKAAKTIRYNKAYFVDVGYLQVKFWKGKLIIGIMGQNETILCALIIDINDIVQITYSSDETRIRIM